MRHCALGPAPVPVSKPSCWVRRSPVPSALGRPGPPSQGCVRAPNTAEQLIGDSRAAVASLPARRWRGYEDLPCGARPVAPVRPSWRWCGLAPVDPEADVHRSRSRGRLSRCGRADVALTRWTRPVGTSPPHAIRAGPPRPGRARVHRADDVQRPVPDQHPPAPRPDRGPRHGKPGGPCDEVPAPSMAGALSCPPPPTAPASATSPPRRSTWTPKKMRIEHSVCNVTNDRQPLLRQHTHQSKPERRSWFDSAR